MVVVPRLFEVLRARMVKTIEKQGKAAQWMLEQALRLGRVRYERGRLPLHEKPLDLLLERTFRPKVRNRFGGRLTAMVSGGAPLNSDVGLFFQSDRKSVVSGQSVSVSVDLGGRPIIKK